MAGTRRQSRTRLTARSNDEAMPQWFLFTIVVLLAGLICLTVNIRAFTESRNEVQQNTELSSEIEQLTNENALLQQEVHSLKTDEATIEREAQKLGFIKK
jgi:cell division protein FtsB